MWPCRDVLVQPHHDIGDGPENGQLTLAQIAGIRAEVDDRHRIADRGVVEQGAEVGRLGLRPGGDLDFRRAVEDFAYRLLLCHHRQLLGAAAFELGGGFLPGLQRFSLFGADGRILCNLLFDAEEGIGLRLTVGQRGQDIGAQRQVGELDRAARGLDLARGGTGAFSRLSKSTASTGA